MSEPSPRAILQATNLVKRVASPAGPLTILAGLSLSIDDGDRIAVVGESGSGKSTLLGLLAGLDTPTEGTVHLAGHDLGGLDEDGRAALRAGRVGFVFQSFHLLPSLTALENVMLPLELCRHTTPGTTAAAILERVALGPRLHHYPRQLSGGEQQRVAIARAFAGAPRILFADEPTGNLDRATGARVAELLFDLNAESDTTLVLVTHDTHLAEPCNRVIELDAGRIVN